MSSEIPYPSTPDPLNRRVDGSELLSLSVGKRKRLIKALHDSYFVFPLDRNTYRVISYKDDSDKEPKEYTVSIFYTPICECMDFVLHCAGRDKWCKHTLRVWAEIHAGDLPPLGADPIDWLDSRIRDSLLELITALDAHRAEDIEPPEDLVQRSEELRDALKMLQNTDEPSAEILENVTRSWKRNRTEQ